MNNLEITKNTLGLYNSIVLKGNITGIDALNLMGQFQIEITKGKSIYLDLGGVNKIDLTGLNAILMLYSGLSRIGEEVFLLDTPPCVHHQMHLTKMASLFNFKTDRRKVLAA